MCEKLEQACVCKLARFVAQTRLTELQELDITSNRIDTLPTAVFEHLPALETLVVARNKIRAIPPEISGLASLRVLDIRENPIETMPFETIAKLPKLERVLVHGLSPEIIVPCYAKNYGPRGYGYGIGAGILSGNYDGQTPTRAPATEASWRSLPVDDGALSDEDDAGLLVDQNDEEIADEVIAAFCGCGRETVRDL
ncbi:Leucine-rich repeat-containing protein 47 [Hondaea fermentalgiana]|uniref:Leucine-rich repeat-containing protein 47 n=1 Tax=Hondaea fermentalgiana TaxID=2315210 RepID=A0A2R5GMY2_9STRA|nr:Leucine-rich repeat-containing protein 47 [Hondaea fermentalgiana]|eukprot:GBG32250.1 Leucine-rich repeat-containing protein 47 [Hondaea fermentalgiana]